MTLEQAIRILCEVHISNFREENWSIDVGASPGPWNNHHDYTRAWTILRNRLVEYEMGMPRAMLAADLGLNEDGTLIVAERVWFLVGDLPEMIDIVQVYPIYGSFGE